jgi:acetyl-CoA acetyltransferase
VYKLKEESNLKFFTNGSSISNDEKGNLFIMTPQSPSEMAICKSGVWQDKPIEFFDGLPQDGWILLQTTEQYMKRNNVSEEELEQNWNKNRNKGE